MTIERIHGRRSIGSAGGPSKGLLNEQSVAGYTQTVSRSIVVPADDRQFQPSSTRCATRGSSPSLARSRWPSLFAGATTWAILPLSSSTSRLAPRRRCRSAREGALSRRMPALRSKHGGRPTPALMLFGVGSDDGDSALDGRALKSSALATRDRRQAARRQQRGDSPLIDLADARGDHSRRPPAGASSPLRPERVSGLLSVASPIRRDAVRHRLLHAQRTWSAPQAISGKSPTPRRGGGHPALRELFEGRRQRPRKSTRPEKRSNSVLSFGTACCSAWTSASRVIHQMTPVCPLPPSWRAIEPGAVRFVTVSTAADSTSARSGPTSP